jgi:hypothetical protein
LDANVSVAKSISFRSDNSNRINLEVSGTESGSNAGANFFIRRYSDAGALIDTPLTITRSTGLITLATALAGTSATFSGDLTIDTNTLYVDSANNRVGIGTVSPSVRLQVLGGTITTNTQSSYAFGVGNSSGYDLTFGTDASFAYIQSWGSRPLQINNQGNNLILNATAGNVLIGSTTDGGARLQVSGGATFSGLLDVSKSGQAIRILASSTDATYQQIQNTTGNMIVGNESSVGGAVFTGTSAYAGIIGTASIRDFFIGTNSVQRLKIDGTSGAATFSSSVKAAAGFNSLTDTIGVANVTWVTIYTIPSTQAAEGVYNVYAHYNDDTGGMAFTQILADRTYLREINNSDSTVLIQLSGRNIQVQHSYGVTVNIDWSILIQKLR